MANAALRVLCIHGVGGHPVGGQWERDWDAAIRAGLQLSPSDPAAMISFVHYDDICAKYPISPVDVAEAVFKLVGNAITEPFRRSRGFGDTLRLTAGMVVQWVENGQFRSETRHRLADEIEALQPDVIVGHSLGSLISYDAFTYPKTASLLKDRYFISLGSQINNPFVCGQFLAGRVQALSQARHWFHLYNPEDNAFTAEIRLSEANFSQVRTRFDVEGMMNHEATCYLSHKNAASQAWWPITHPGSAAVISRSISRGLSTRRAVTRLQAPRNRALLIGINEYPSATDRLNGCVNDAFLMSSLLQESGIDAEDIRMVLDSRATAANIRDRLEWLLDDIQDGDYRVVYYSGHGAQLPSYGPGERVESVKECLVPHDFDWTEGKAITDEWFHSLYAQLPYGARFVAIFDCCHSGGLARAGLPRIKGLNPPDDVRHRALRWSAKHDMWVERDFTATNKAFLDKKLAQSGQSTATDLRTTDRLGYAMSLRTLPEKEYKAMRKRRGHEGPYMPLLLYACGAQEYSYEYQHGSISHGAFTYSLAKTWRRQQKERKQAVTYKGLVGMVRRELEQLGYDQKPSVAGPTQVLTQKVRLLA